MLQEGGWPRAAVATLRCRCARDELASTSCQRALSGVAVCVQRYAPMLGVAAALAHSGSTMGADVSR